MASRLFFLCVMLGLASFVFAQLPAEEQLADEYFAEGEYEKALSLYQKVHKDNEGFRLVLKITQTFTALKQFSQAHEFLDKQIKKNNREHLLPALKGLILTREGKTTDATTLWTNLINKLQLADEFAKIGQFFFQNKQYEWAENNYLQARKVLKNDFLFSDELAEVYIANGEYGKAVTQILVSLLQNPSTIDLVKGKIAILTNEQTYDAIETALLQSVNKHKDQPVLVEILFDFYVQSERYEDAFAQVKQLDRIYQDGGNRLYQYAKVLQNNQKYVESNQVLDYLIQKPQSQQQFSWLAYQEKAINAERIAFEQKPIQKEKVFQVKKSYNELLARFGKQSQFHEAIYRKAYLCAFYLQELDTAVQELEALLTMPAVPLNEKHKAQLLLGDIWLIKGENAKAELQYNTVEKANKDAQIGALAKFKQAMLFYYRADFDMAKAYFKVLKDNTTNDIANDAIQMFLLLQDNMGMDTTAEAMKQFANAQLLVFQKKYDAAYQALDSLTLQFPGHALKDDILWQKIQIAYQQEDIQKTLLFLDQLLSNYSPCVYTDDAIFLKAELYDYYLNQPKQAIDLYLQLLMEHPSSVYKVQARKRIRFLRGENN